MDVRSIDRSLEAILERFRSLRRVPRTKYLKQFRRMNISRTKKYPLPMPSLTDGGRLVCSACGCSSIRVTNAPGWGPVLTKRRRYECTNRECRRSWFTNESFETIEDQAEPQPALLPESGLAGVVSASDSSSVAEVPETGQPGEPSGTVSPAVRDLYRQIKNELLQEITASLREQSA